MQAYTRIECPEVAIADLSLDQWKPITPQQLTEHLTDNAYYDGEYFVPPVVQSIDLPKNTNAVVWCFCAHIDNKDDEDVAMMAPMLLILTSWRDEQDIKRKYLCFART